MGAWAGGGFRAEGCFLGVSARNEAGGPLRVSWSVFPSLLPSLPRLPFLPWPFSFSPLCRGQFVCVPWQVALGGLKNRKPAEVPQCRGRGRGGSVAGCHRPWAASWELGAGSWELGAGSWELRGTLARLWLCSVIEPVGLSKSLEFSAPVC